MEPANYKIGRKQTLDVSSGIRFKPTEPNTVVNENGKLKFQKLNS